MQLALDDRLSGGPDWHSREARGAIVLGVGLLHALLFALLIATKPVWRQEAALPELTVELVRQPADQDVDAAPAASSTAEPEQSGAIPPISLPGPARPIAPPRQRDGSPGPATSQALPGPPAHCQNQPATLNDPLGPPPCEQPAPPDERARKALGDLINPGDRTGLAKEAEKATSNAAHIELFTILNDRFRPTAPSEERSRQSRSEAALGMPGRDISVFASPPSVFDKNPH